MRVIAEELRLKVQIASGASPHEVLETFAWIDQFCERRGGSSLEEEYARLERRMDFLSPHAQIGALPAIVNELEQFEERLDDRILIERRLLVRCLALQAEGRRLLGDNRLARVLFARAVEHRRFTKEFDPEGHARTSFLVGSFFATEARSPQASREAAGYLYEAIRYERIAHGDSKKIATAWTLIAGLRLRLGHGRAAARCLQRSQEIREEF